MRTKHLCILSMLAAAAACTGARPVHAATITVTYGPTLSAMIAGSDPGALGLAGAATAAASAWGTILTDPITIKFALEVEAMPGSALGYFDVDAPGVTSSFAYSAVKSALTTDATSPTDVMAVGSLQSGPSLNVITNDTLATPSLRKHYIPGVTPGTDEYIVNSFLRLTRANQKALGFLAPADGAPGADGTLKINSSILSSLDFTPGDGITPGTTDGVALLLHEMAHGLGFISGVDHIDFAGEAGPFRGRPAGYGSDTDLKDETIFSTLDLFRYSTDSTSISDQPSAGKTLDWAFGASSGDPTSGPYFSVDGGTTKMGFFSTGEYNGDGFQAQHWKNDTLAPIFPGAPVGLLDPSIGFGTLGILTMTDLRAMDAIGYNLVPVPEPSSLLTLAAGLALLRRRERRQTRHQ